MESLWLQWPVAAGCGKPVAAMACGRWLWKALATGSACYEHGQGSHKFINAPQKFRTTHRMAQQTLLIIDKINKLFPK